MYLLGVRSPKYWTEDELQMLEEMVTANKTPSYIAIILNRTISSVSHQMKRRGLKRKHCWTAEEEKELLKMLKKDISIKNIAEELGRSESSIRSKIWRNK
jgi:IS30 family transposase